MVSTVAEDEETQKRGCVGINYWVDQALKLDFKLFNAAGKSLEWLPVRFGGVHFCTDNQFIRSAFSVVASQLFWSEGYK